MKRCENPKCFVRVCMDDVLCAKCKSDKYLRDMYGVKTVVPKAHQKKIKRWLELVMDNTWRF